MSDRRTFLRGVAGSTLASLVVRGQEPVPMGMGPVETAGQEILRVLCWEDSISSEMVARFESKMRQQGREVSVRVSVAQTTGNFFNAAMLRSQDVINPGHEELKAGRFRYLYRRLAQPLNWKRMSHYPSLNRCLKHLNAIWMGEELWALPGAGRRLNLVYQVVLEEPPPYSWTALWDDLYVGRTAVGYDDAKGNTYLSCLASGLQPHEIGDPEKMEEAGVAERLLLLALNACNFWRRDRAEEFKNCDLGTSWGQGAMQLRNQATNWAVIDPREGTPARLDLWMMTQRPKTTAQRELAEDWIDFCLSPEVQLDAMRRAGLVPVVEGLEAQATPEEVGLFYLSDPLYFVDQLVIFPALNEQRERLVTKLWEMALQECGRF